MRLNALLSLAWLTCLASPLAHSQSEAEHRDRLCAGWATEVYFESTRTRADCLSPTHAIEVDWSSKWAEGIGQALHYADMTGLIPGLILICDNRSTCQRHFLTAEQTVANWGLPIKIWYCLPVEALEECG